MNYRNVYLRKDGRYEGRLFLDTSGSKRKYHAFFGKTHDEVIAKMKKYHIDLISKTQIRKTFTEVYEEWFGTVTIRIKESTAANYILKADKHILPFFGQKCICKITNDDIYDFIRRKQQENLSNRYITDILVLMKSIFKYAYKTYKIDNIMDGIVMPKKPRVEIRILNDDEDKKLCDILAQKNDLTSIGIYLSRVTGLRIGELCALKWENIDIEQGIISVNKTLQRIQVKNGLCKTKLMLAEPKSESSKRKIPIPKCVLELLKNNRGRKPPTNSLPQAGMSPHPDMAPERRSPSTRRISTISRKPSPHSSSPNMTCGNSPASASTPPGKATSNLMPPNPVNTAVTKTKRPPASKDCSTPAMR